jgi:hypothetical protein
MYVFMVCNIMLSYVHIVDWLNQDFNIYIISHTSYFMVKQYLVP